MDEYYEILNGLSRIRRQTIRRILDHLRDVTEHSHSNLATVDNVVKVFGPTLFSVENVSSFMCDNFDFSLLIVFFF